MLGYILVMDKQVCKGIGEGSVWELHTLQELIETNRKQLAASAGSPPIISLFTVYLTIQHSARSLKSEKYHAITD